MPVTDIFCTLGTTIKKAGSEDAFRQVDYDYALQLARWGVRNGAKQFLLVSPVDAGPKSRNFYLRVKGELEAAVNGLPYNAVHVFRPSMLLGSRAGSRPILRCRSCPTLPPPSRKISSSWRMALHLSRRA